MAENVLADAQYTVASVLRPFDGFEQQYQGRQITIPICFPGTLDKDAGKPGFSPYLLAGLPVPVGAPMTLWFPAVVGALEGIPAIDYNYILIWRMRNVGDFQRNRLPYHLAKEAFGAPDTYLAPTSPDRFVLPAATETVSFLEPEAPIPPGFPGIITGQGQARVNLRTEQIDVPSDNRELVSAFPTVGLPLLPPNAAPPFANGFPFLAFPIPGPSKEPLGAYQQGIIDPASGNLAPSSMFRPYRTVAKGDELIIACYRNNTLTDVPGAELWSFNSFDFQFSNLYGTNAFPPVGTASHKPFPDLGIYVLAGAGPAAMTPLAFAPMATPPP